MIAFSSAEVATITAATPTRRKPFDSTPQAIALASDEDRRQLCKSGRPEEQISRFADLPMRESAALVAISQSCRAAVSGIHDSAF